MILPAEVARSFPDERSDVAVVLALISSALWGTSDFIGGTVSRRLPSATVLLWATVLSLPFLAAVAVGSGDLQWSSTTVGWGIAAGIAGALGIASLYQGLSTGVMGVVAPISSTAVIVPVIVGFAIGESVSALTALGIVIAIVGVVLAGGPHLRDFATGGHRPILFALGAALGIGLSLSAIARGSEASSISTLLSMRLTYVVVLVVLVLIASSQIRPDRAATLVPLLAIGLLDTTANGLYAVASRVGPLVIVAVLASLYPVATLFLARQLHGERLSRIQTSGVLLALVGVCAVVGGR